LLRIICNTVGGFDRSWAFLTKLLRFTLVAPGKLNNTASAYGSAMGSIGHAVRHGQPVDPRRNAEDMMAVLQAARKEQDGHNTSEEEDSPHQMKSTEQMTKHEQQMDNSMYPVIMNLVQAGPFKTQYADAALVDADIKKASVVIFTIMYRMPMTILEYATATKILVEEWKFMPFNSTTESMDMFQKCQAVKRSGHSDWMMPYLAVAQNLQSRAQTYSGKLALQRYVELVETGISEGGLEPAIVYFQTVQNLFINETKTHVIDNVGSTHPEHQNLERLNRDLLRQIQKLQAQPGKLGQWGPLRRCHRRGACSCEAQQRRALVRLKQQSKSGNIHFISFGKQSIDLIV
jgi:hypothetical protein